MRAVLHSGRLYHGALLIIFREPGCPLPPPEALQNPEPSLLPPTAPGLSLKIKFTQYTEDERGVTGPLYLFLFVVR